MWLDIYSTLDPSSRFSTLPPDIGEQTADPRFRPYPTTWTARLRLILITRTLQTSELMDYSQCQTPLNGGWLTPLIPVTACRTVQVPGPLFPLHPDL